jgi:hypothetical protein
MAEGLSLSLEVSDTANSDRLAQIGLLQQLKMALLILG